MSDYRDDLLADLSDTEYAALYLTQALHESVGAFLVALKDVSDAVIGMSKLAESAKANRVSLYRALSEKGNPTLRTLDSILGALNLDVTFSPRSADTLPTQRKQTGRLATTQTSAKNARKR